MSVATRAGDRVVVMLTSPLEPEHVERIASAFPDRIDLIFRPDLMPAPRYVADHGDPAWRRNPAQEREWHRLLGQAEVLLDFPPYEPRPLLELAPKLRWVQTTSAGVGPLVQRLGLQDSHLLVTTASGIHAQPLAEFVFAALLYHTKEIGRLKEEQRAHQWHRFAGIELAGQTMAIVGPGPDRPGDRPHRACVPHARHRPGTRQRSRPRGIARRRPALQPRAAAR